MLSILGIIAVIVAAYHIYKTAKDTERSAVGWALLTLGVGFGMQLILPMIIGIIMAVFLTASGSSAMEIQNSINDVALFIGIGGLAASFIGIWLIMRHVSKIPDEKPFTAPPSPPTFNGNQASKNEF